MTTLYRPVLIESAEQAEALPEGAIVINRDNGDKYHRVTDGSWWSDHDMGGPLSVDLEYDAIEALVPIEAEEETRVTPEALARAAGQMLDRAADAARTYALPPTPLVIQQQARLVTPWEETP